MILVSLDEILSLFAGIPTVLYTLHKLYPTITCEEFHPGKAGYLSFALPVSRFAGMKFSDVIASALLKFKKV